MPDQSKPGQARIILDQAAGPVPADLGPPPAPLDPALVQHVAEETCRIGEVPALMGLIVDRDAGTLPLAIGTADLRTGEHARHDLVGRVGGATQTLVATAVLQMVGEGKLSLDDTIEQHVPGLVPWGEQVTLRSLLNHTSGIEDFQELRRFKDKNEYLAERWTTFSPSDLIRIAVESGPVVPVGTWYFGFTNFVAVGMIIESVTGNTVQAEVTRRIIEPLGLRNTFFPVTQPDIPFRYHARGYFHLDDGSYLDVTELNPSLAGAGRSLLSNMPDLVTFWRALVAERSLLPDSLWREMFTFLPVADPSPAPDSHDGIQAAQGLGIIRVVHPTGVVSYGSHGAGMHGFDTSVHVSADGSRAVGGMVNQYIEDEKQGAVLLAYLTAGYCSTSFF
jgi:D-alanyl-D-alanine carboxypeptidase